MVGLAAGGAPFDLENLQALCKPCHLVKTTTERGGVPHAPDAAWGRLTAELL